MLSDAAIHGAFSSATRFRHLPTRKLRSFTIGASAEPTCPRSEGIDGRGQLGALPREHVVGALPPTPATTPIDQPENKQQQNGADRGRYDRGNQPASQMDAQFRQQPSADQRSDDPDADIRDETETGAAHDLTGEPAGDQSDDQDDQKTFPRHCLAPVCARSRLSLAQRTIAVTRSMAHARARSPAAGTGRTRKVASS